MKSVLDIRITRWPFKLVYIVVVWFGVRYAVRRLLGSLEGDLVVDQVILGLLDLAIVLLGARMFRGRGEPVEPARAWWRLTSRSPLSFVLGFAIVAANLLGLPGVIYGISLGQRTEWFVAEGIAVFFAAVLAVLYFLSGARLRRAELAAGPAPQVFPFHGRVLEIPGPTTRITVEESISTSAGSDGIAALLAPSKDGRRITVHVNGTRVGSLPEEAVDVRDLIARSGGRVRVELVRTGDRLWAEVPIEGLVEAVLDEPESALPA